MNNLHNKTQEVQETELPYNPNNCLIQAEDIRKLFDEHGLEGMPMHNINLYRNAFVHRSYCTMKNDDFESGNERCPSDCLPLQEMSYERLEFIGDSILGMVCATYLYERYPDQAEGFLSKLRTKLVNGKMLGYLSDKIGFPKYVLISKQVEEVHGRSNYKIMEDVFEAFIGAIYMDYNTADYSVSFPDIKPVDFFPFFKNTWTLQSSSKHVPIIKICWFNICNIPSKMRLASLKSALKSNKIKKSLPIV